MIPHIPKRHKEDYNRDGYTVIRGAYTATPVNHVLSKLRLLFGGGELRDAMKRSYAADAKHYVSVLSLCTRLPAIQDIFLCGGLLREMGKYWLSFPCFASQPVLHVLSPDLQIPGGYHGTAAHQDWPSVQGSLDMVTVWIPLTDAGIGNYPLEVIPGSHLGGLREGKLNGSVLEIECDDKDFVPVECKAGDVVFLSGFTIHRTGAGNGFRIAVSQRFDNAAEPTFIERGYPCAQKRVVQRELITPGFPTMEQVRKIYE